MFSKQEASQLKKDFWTVFGNYMKPVPSAGGEKVHWLNYKTGEKNIFFRMDATKESAIISIELTHSDPGMQALYFEQFLMNKQLLKNETGEEWNWQLHTINAEGRIITRIYKSLSGVNIFNRAQWPQIISFLKPRIIALDNFWAVAKWGFEALR